MPTNFSGLKEIIPSDKLYDDVLSPALKQIGKSLESVAKTSRFIFAPFEYLAIQHDRWQRHLEKVANRIEEKNLTEGQPQIVIPTLEGLSLATENSLLSELFINLLANSIDITKQNLAHPSFPNLIKQLSHDEAVILFHYKKKDYAIKEKALYDINENIMLEKEKFSDEFPLEALMFPQHFDASIEHVISFNLITTIQSNDIEAMRDESGLPLAYIIPSKRKLSAFGRLFADACVPDRFEGL